MKKIFVLFIPVFLLWGEEESSSHVQVSSLEQIEILEEDIFEGQTNFYEEQADISESFSDQAAIHEQVDFQDKVAQRDQDLSQVDLDCLIVKELKGIALIDNPVDMKRNIDDLEDVEYVNFHPPAPSAEKLKNNLLYFIGKPITIRLLNELRQDVTKFYHDRGYPLVGVSVPSGQDITDGRIFVLILVAQVGEVKAEGAQHFSNDWLKKQITLKPGDDIRTAPLLEDLARLNNNPFRTVDMIYEKGDSLAETNILLRTQDVDPWRLYTGYEYTGNIIG